jgi:hypothetical protein
MYFVTRVGGGRAFVINPTMEGVLKQAPTEKAYGKTDHGKNQAGTEDEYFPEKKKPNGRRVADKSKPIVEIANTHGNSVLSSTFKKALSGVLE